MKRCVPGKRIPEIGMHMSPQMGPRQQIWPDGQGVEQLGQTMLKAACWRPLDTGHR